MAEQFHALKATDLALCAHLSAKGVLEADRIVRLKDTSDLAFPFVVVASLNAERKSKRNWRVTGAVTMRTSIVQQTLGGTAAQKLAESDELERTLLEVFEEDIASDDNPKALAASIQASAIAAGVVEADDYLMTAFYITGINQEADDDGSWAFVIDFAAGVVA